MNRPDPLRHSPLATRHSPLSRRDFLWQGGGGLGGIALAALLAQDGLLAADITGVARPRADGGLHHAPRARRVVQLFMAGAASHIDLFDFKPELIKRHGQPSDFGEHVEAFQNGLGPWLRPVFGFKPYGSCGKMLGDPVAALGDVVDDIAFVHNVVGKTGVHSQGTLLQTTGFNRPGFPSIGSWVSYGLGRMTDNLPAFVVMPDHRGLASNGTKNWDPAFLPSQHQGTVIYPGSKTPIADLFPDDRVAFPTRRCRRGGDRGAESHEPRALGDPRRRRPARGPDQELRAGRQDAARRARGAGLLERAERGAPAVRARPRQVVVRQGDQPARGDRLLRPQVPGRPPAARAWGPVRPGLERQRQRLPAAELGLARGRRSATTARSPRAWPAAPRP